MANSLRNLAILALLTTLATLGATQASGSGHTTRYWDCCKTSCAWPGKAAVSAPVSTCDIHDQPLSNPKAGSGCNGGSAYMCSNQSPWAVSNDLAYGFASVSIAGGSESSWCCACYELTFTSGPDAGKKMVVQATNTGGDLGSNQFDLAVNFSQVWCTFVILTFGNRFPAAMSVSSTAARTSGVRRPRVGASNTVVSHRTLATRSLVHSSLAATSAMVGSRAPTTQGELSSRLSSVNKVISNVKQCQL